eukprot:TRINITY_DN2171_c0_g2_i3.p1 TRINITY_DN2171_c0_g2~~TRINITY_DN2171_c0_g2_i3.p1  ORF type:complete len:705 (-),score=134.98 TRINITY_DN2171_c0_g2_i3:153-2267(-)
MHHVAQQQAQYSQSKREVGLKFADLLKTYSTLVKGQEVNSTLAVACENASNFLIALEAKQAKLDAFIMNSFVAPLMTFVRGDIHIALEAKGKYDRALQAYDQQITALQELKKKAEKKPGSGKTKQQKAEQELFVLKQTFEQADLDARNKLQDTRAKNGFQSLEHIVNFASAYTEFFSEGAQTIAPFFETDYLTSIEKLREDYMATQLKRPQVTVVKPKLQKKAVYGVDIQDVWTNSETAPDRLPSFLTSIFTYLYKNCLKLEGVFRLSANKEEVKAFKVSIDQGNQPDYSTVDDPHVVSNLLSVWLREMPSPLCTFQLYERFLAVQANVENKKAYVHMLSNTIKQLPAPNRAVLQHLLHLLANVSLYSETNKMTPSNLAIVFGPTILYGEKADALTFAVVNGVVEGMIKHYEELFGEPVATDKYNIRPKRPERPMSIMPNAANRMSMFPKTPPPERPDLPNPTTPPLARPQSTSLPSSPPTVTATSERPMSMMPPGSSSAKRQLPLFVRSANIEHILRRASVDAADLSSHSGDSTSPTTEHTEGGVHPIQKSASFSRPPVPTRGDRRSIDQKTPLSSSSTSSLLGTSSSPSTLSSSGTQSPSSSPRPSPPMRPERSPFLYRRSASVASVDEAQRFTPEQNPQVDSKSTIEQKSVIQPEATPEGGDLSDYDPSAEYDNQDYGVEYELDELTETADSEYHEEGAAI